MKMTKKKYGSSREFPDKPTPGRKTIIWWGVISLFIISLVLTIFVPDNRHLLVPTVILWHLTVGFFVLIILDKLNIGAVDIYLAPKTERSLWLYLIGFVGFFILARTPEGGIIIDSMISMNFIFTIALIVSPIGLLTSLLFTQANIFAETGWFHSLPIAIAKAITQSRLRMAGLGFIFTVISFPLLAVGFSAITAVAFHWESHQIDFSHPERMLPAALLFGVWTVIGLLPKSGLDVVLFCHSGWNAGILSALTASIVVTDTGMLPFGWIAMAVLIITFIVVTTRIPKKK